MIDDDEIARPAPPRAYEPSDQILRVPTSALSATLDLLQSAGRRECCVFWYGRRTEAGGSVASVRAPAQRMTWGNYSVSAGAMSEMTRDLPEDLRPLAQIHSHPGVRVEHSRYDDQMVASRRALSIVFPSYGRINGPWPSGIGVHEWQLDYWHFLAPDLAARRVRVVEAQSIDARDFR
jgi:hypothetical protein